MSVSYVFTFSTRSCKIQFNKDSNTAVRKFRSQRVLIHFLTETAFLKFLGEFENLNHATH